MPNLIHRAEEALLGGLIYDPSLVNDVPYLLPHHFSEPFHRDVFASFLNVHANAPDVWGAAMAELIARHMDLPDRVSELTGWALASEPSSVAGYGRIVQEAALRRELADHAARLAEAAGPVRGLDPDLDHLATLASALQAHAANFQAAVSYELHIEAPRQDLHALREEQLLADLIQHPRYLPEVVDWLDPDVFTTADRRDIYTAIITADHVEELTVAIKLAHTKATEHTVHGTAAQNSRPIAPGYVSRLASLTVEPGSSIQIARELLAEHTRSSLATELTHQPTRLTSIEHQPTLDQDHATRRPAPEPLLTQPDHAHRHDGPQLRQ